MSFDDLFGLLLFVLFIALPALSRMSRSRKPGGGTPTRPGAPATGRAPTASTARPASPAPAGGTGSAAGGDELERRVAEARERVRRALEGPGGSSGPAAGGAQAPTRSTAPVPTPARAAPVRRTAFVSTDRDDGLLSTPLDPRAVGMLGPERLTPRRRPAPFSEAPALQVERPGARARVAPPGGRPAAAFATDPETVRMAIIWHQVLGEPRARRPLGGRPSTLRSR